MAKLDNLLIIKKNGRTWRCVSYTTQGEATPEGGSCLEILNQGVRAYLALSPNGDTPLSVKKDGVLYYLQTEVKIGTVKIDLPELHNQSIKLTYVDVEGNTKTITSKIAQTIIARVNTPYKVELIPDDGYIVGEITGSPLTGTTSNPLSWVESSQGTVKPLNVSIVADGCTVLVNGQAHTGTITANYGDIITLYCEVPEGYVINKILVNGSPFNNGGKYVVRGNINIVCDKSLKKFTFTVNPSVNQTYVVTLGDVVHPSTNTTSTYMVDYGTNYSVIYTAKEDDDVYHYVASGNEYGVVKDNITISTKSATMIPQSEIIKHYTVTFTKNANCSYCLKDSGSNVVFDIPMGNGTMEYTGVQGDYSLHTVELKDGYSFESFTVNDGE